LITVNGPQASITANPDSGCVPLNIQFNSQVIPTTPIVSYDWDYGDGNVGTGANPTHTYTAGGNYPVSLVVTDAEGCTATANLANSILATEPIADFVAPFPSECPGFPVAFNNLSTGQALSYLWDFGDGNTSTASNPSHAYGVAGTYTVSLTITDVNACVHTETKTNYVTIADLTAGIFADTTTASCPPLLVNFQAISSLGSVSSYQWDFGNGTVSSQANPSHIYAVPGTFDVTLILTTGSGCMDTAFAPSLIDLAGPYGTFSFGPDSGCPDLNVLVDVNPTNTVLYQYDMGDGTLQTSADSSYLHTYTLPGTYFPQILLNDGLGCDVLITSSDPIVVFPLPLADFSASDTVVCDAGVSISFTDMSQAASGISSWQWDFGDGTTSVQANPSHQYAQLGSYDVSLIVFSNDGCSDTLLRPGFIQVVSPPQADIALVDSVGCLIFTVGFADASIPANSPLSSWQWDFGDGSPSGNASLVTHAFDSVGTFITQMIVTDSLGCMDTAYQSIEVLPLPEPDFSVLPDSFGCAPFVGQFLDNTTGAVDWRWDFGDGSPVQFGSNPSHLYQTDGTYSVQLVVTDLNNCIDSLTKTNYIVLNHPVADFEVDSPICPLGVATFTDLSQSDTSLVFWEWEYGDGQSGQGNPAFHSYNTPGFYDVQLIVSDFFNCRDTLIKPNAIEVLVNEVPNPPAIEFATVINQGAIRIRWERYQSTLDDFGEYILLRSENGGPYVQAFSGADINQLQYLDLGLDTEQNRYCYLLQVSNYCDLSSAIGESVEHCVVNMTSLSLPEQIELQWTPYEGWPNGVERYEIYRVPNYDPSSGTLLATVNGNILNYLDREMNCEEAFSYRVQAFANNTSFQSWSDTTRNRPIHARIQEEAHIVRASVENNTNVLVEWELPSVAGLVDYLIEKDAGNGFQSVFNGPINLSTFSYVDMDVSVSDQTYDYRAFAIDTCGDLTPVGRLGRTILLQANYANARVQLDWSAYEQWASGVESYRIEIYDEDAGQFIQQAIVGGGALSYLDEDPDIGQPINCYRITAVESGGVLSESHSNEVCVTLNPIMFAANAFTPNNDGKNDRFVLKGTFVDQFRMDIYNRWGELIYSTNDIEEGWDGRMRDGSPAPEGVYIYVANGDGYSGIGDRRSGTVSLYR
ncbi:MAG: PKD domain-containing protein, partial [Bacteroidota bacterium]